VPLSKFVPRGFVFVHHSIAILYHQVPNPDITIRLFFASLRSGVAADPAVALSLFTAAHAAGLPAATHALGACHQHGLGVPVDLTRATKLFFEAVQAGDADAHASLGRCGPRPVGLSRSVLKRLLDCQGAC
jgi:hypothetical protein